VADAPSYAPVPIADAKALLSRRPGESRDPLFSASGSGLVGPDFRRDDDFS